MKYNENRMVRIKITITYVKSICLLAFLKTDAILNLIHSDVHGWHDTEAWVKYEGRPENKERVGIVE